MSSDPFDLIFDETREEMRYFWERPTPVYERPATTPGTLWGDLVERELQTLWQIRRSLDRAGMGFFLRQFISNNPYKDISLLTWCVTILGWWEYGLKMVWVTVVNLFLVAALRAAFQAPRPFEYDSRLRPLADRHMTSYGFPSIESYMAVITFGYLGHRLGHPAWQLITFATTIFIGATRLYAGSRFVHQVVLSWVIGAVALWVYINRFQKLIPDWGEDVRIQKMRIFLLAPWAMAFLAYVGLAMEDNSSSLWRVPNSEFVRVMTHIMDTGAAAAQREGAAGHPGDRVGANSGFDGTVGNDDDADDDPLIRQYQNRGLSRLERRRRLLAERRDSFFHLQHSIREKSIQRHQIRSQVPDGGMEDEDYGLGQHRE